MCRAASRRMPRRRRGSAGRHSPGHLGARRRRAQPAGRCGDTADRAGPGRAEHLLGAGQQRRGAARAARRRRAARPPARPARSRHRRRSRRADAPSRPPGASCQIRTERDQAGTRGDDRARPLPQGARVRGHGVGGERQSPDAELPSSAPGSSARSAPPRVARPAAPISAGTNPVAPASWSGADQRHQLLHEVRRVDAAGSRCAPAPRHDRRRVAPAAAEVSAVAVTETTRRPEPPESDGGVIRVASGPLREAATRQARARPQPQRSAELRGRHARSSEIWVSAARGRQGCDDHGGWLDHWMQQAPLLSFPVTGCAICWTGSMTLMTGGRLAPRCGVRARGSLFVRDPGVCQ